jgi:hypothetical protein
MMEHESSKTCHGIRVARTSQKGARSLYRCAKSIPPCSQSAQVIAVAKRGTRRAKWRRCLGNNRSIMGLDSVLFLAERFPTRARALSPKGGLGRSRSGAKSHCLNEYRIGGY